MWFTYVFTSGGLKNLSVLCLSTVRASSNDSRQLENTASTFARSNLQEDKNGTDTGAKGEQQHIIP